MPTSTVHKERSKAKIKVSFCEGHDSRHKIKNKKQEHDEIFLFFYNVPDLESLGVKMNKRPGKSRSSNQNANSSRLDLFS